MHVEKLLSRVEAGKKKGKSWLLWEGGCVCDFASNLVWMVRAGLTNKQTASKVLCSWRVALGAFASLKKRKRLIIVL
jgi:hypothetical protein